MNSLSMALVLAVSWMVISLAYFSFIFVPSELHILINMVCCLVAVGAVALLPARQIMLKTYLVGFSAATWLSTLQVSTSQRPFETNFLVFFALHALLLGAAIGIGSLVQPRRPMHVKEKWRLANLSVYAFIAIAAYVLLNGGIRLNDFMQGEKISGDIYKIPGISGLQGIFSIFILCCFSKLTKFNKFLFIVSIVIIAIADVKRGEIIRIATFLVFYSMIVNPRHITRILAISVIGVFVFVAFGEVRQHFYSDGFSISYILNSRIGIVSVDWIYGYLGINVSVLQEYFYADTGSAGYFATLSGLIFNTEIPEFDRVSILGFNAATVFSMFTGQQSMLPSFDFMMFCVLVGAMVAFASRLGTPSLRAFMLVQIFGFVFGNQLILPYYLVGFFAAVAYQSLPRIVLGKRPVQPGRLSSVEQRDTFSSA